MRRARVVDCGSGLRAGLVGVVAVVVDAVVAHFVGSGVHEWVGVVAVGRRLPHAAVRQDGADHPGAIRERAAHRLHGGIAVVVLVRVAPPGRCGFGGLVDRAVAVVVDGVADLRDAGANVLAPVVAVVVVARVAGARRFARDDHLGAFAPVAVPVAIGVRVPLVGLEHLAVAVLVDASGVADLDRVRAGSGDAIVGLRLLVVAGVHDRILGGIGGRTAGEGEEGDDQGQDCVKLHVILCRIQSGVVCEASAAYWASQCFSDRAE